MTKENVNVKPSFVKLWPTVLMQLSLPGHESANPVLADLILSKNVEVQNMTENYNEDNIFNMDHPVIFWLQQCIDKAIDDYSKNSESIIHLIGNFKDGGMLI